jgi:hypothetical protein
MHVVATSVHDGLSVSPPIVHIFGALEGKAGLLLDRERIELGSKKNDGAKAVAKDADNTAAANPLNNVKPQGLQAL